VALDAVRELMIWRAIRLAHFIGDWMANYERTHQAGEDPWGFWRTRHGPRITFDFISGLSENDFQLALTCREVWRILTLRHEDDLLTLPSDGDLEPVAGCLWVETTTCEHDWGDLLGKRPRKSTCGISSARPIWLPCSRSSSAPFKKPPVRPSP